MIAFNITPLLPNIPNLKWLFVIHIFFFFIIRRWKHISKRMNDMFILGIDCFPFVTDLECIHLRKSK